MPNGVTLTAVPTTVEVGSTSQVTSVVTPDNATDKTVTFSVDDETIATITGEGVVTAIKSGTATIKGTSGEASGTTKLTVTDPTTK